MNKAERLGLVICACLFYIAIRFLVTCGDNIADIARMVDDRLTTLEEKVAHMEKSVKAIEN